MHKTRYLILFIFLPLLLTAQLKEFEIVEEKAPEIIPIFPNNPNDAAVIIYSSLQNLSFSSNTGGIVQQMGSPAEGKYTLIIRPENQFISIKAVGYREGRIRIRGMNAKDVRYFLVEEKLENRMADRGRFSLNSIPQGAEFKIEGFPGAFSTPFTSEDIIAGAYEVRVSKEGYKDKLITLQIEKGKITTRTVELEMDLDFVAPVTETQISFDVTPVGGLINSARVETENDVLAIYYNLPGDPDDEFEVSLRLKSRTNPDYLMIPNLISGDIGEGAFAGTNRKIVWRMKDEVGVDLTSDELYLELEAEEIGGSSWLWYALGGLGGAAAAVLATMGGGEDSGGGTTTTGIANPPDRPGN